MTKILLFAASTRAGSFNERVCFAFETELKRYNVEVTHINLADYQMPIYESYYEQENGIPEVAKKLYALFEANEGIFIASPEYNASVTPLLKNTLDWMSRVQIDSKPAMNCFKDRIFAIGSASPGTMGGYRGLVALRQILEIGLGALVLPEMVSLGNAHTILSETGVVQDERTQKYLASCADAFVKISRKMSQ